MANRTAAREPELAREVMRYFLRNPRAADTLRGVARWRLLEQRIHHTTEEVQRALEWLVANGYLAISAKGTAPLFSLNRDKTGEAERFLE